MRWKSLSGKEPRREEKPDIKRDMKENKWNENNSMLNRD
jgi:hypothetical protein